MEYNIDIEGNPNSKKKKNHKVWKPTPRRYTFKDFSPTIKDPRCQPDWPLAAYWPVYLGNFKIVLTLLEHYTDEVCERRVRNYFLSKGLPTFMIFRLRDDFFHAYQNPFGLYDMLVYFCCKEDADTAIAKCHQDLYYCHKLHVYDGRTPERFAPTMAYRFEHLELDDRNELETAIAKYMKTYLPVESVRKMDQHSTYVQLSRPLSPEEVETAINIPRFKMMAIPQQAQKQRYIEGDVISELLNEINTNPNFLNMQPVGRTMRFLVRGDLPKVKAHWNSNPDHPRLINSKMLKALRGQGAPKSKAGDVSMKPLSEKLSDKPQQEGDQSVEQISLQQPTNTQQANTSEKLLSKNQLKRLRRRALEAQQTPEQKMLKKRHQKQQKKLQKQIQQQRELHQKMQQQYMN